MAFTALLDPGRVARPDHVDGLPALVGLVLALVILCGGVAGFFLSMFRLHRQMAAVKQREISVTRDLYGTAYGPVRKTRGLEVVERQQGLVGAAEALEKRARAIQEWRSTTEPCPRRHDRDQRGGRDDRAANSRPARL
jgi:hypothetical protein